MEFPEIYSASGLIELIQQIGFLPLLDSGIVGFSAEEIVDEDCGYVALPEGGWEWPLWKWKGEIVTWPDFCNYRRSKYPYPADGSIEEAILSMLHSTGSLITRELRSACGFNGKGMRSKFDSYLTRLEMATYIVTEDFVYPHDKHNHEYGWGWSLLNTPEELYGADACRCDCSPEASFQKIFDHLRAILPEATDRQLLRLIG